MECSDSKIRLVQGKVGTSTEGRFFIALPEDQTAPQDVLKAMGSTCTGVKNGTMLWALPVASDKAAAEAALTAVKACESSSDMSEPVPEQTDDTLSKKTTTESPNGMTAKNHVKSEEGSLSVSAKSSSAHGYVPGMSIAECDSCRRPVRPGTVEPGQMLLVNGVEREIFALSPNLVVADDMVEDLRTRFPDMEITSGMVYQFAMWPFDGRKEPATRSLKDAQLDI